MTNENEPKYLWTIMVYLAGDNNLTEESVFSLTEMKKANIDDRIAVVAQLDPKVPFVPTHRYVINQGRPAGDARSTAGESTLAADAVQVQKPTVTFAKLRPNARRRRTDAGETDTGAPGTLFDFISWSAENFRARRYMVILAGHGAGTEEDFLLKDDNPKSSLTMGELQDVFAAVREDLKINIDILGMDVCLMSMAEVCYELNGLADYLVSSESYSPIAGWPYGQILKQVEAALPDGPPENIAKSIVDEYIRFYGDYVVGGLSVDQSVLQVSASERLGEAVGNCAQVMKGFLREEPFKDALILAHWAAQSYNGELFVDLRDFCDLLSRRAEKDYPTVVTACHGVTEAIGNLVLKSCFTGVENQYSYGVSIYFPWAEVAPTYGQLAFADRTGWNDFLKAYVRETRRQPRNITNNSNRLLGFAVQTRFQSALGDQMPGRFRKSDDRKSDDRGANPIHSMRNPPVVAGGLSDCIRVDRAVVASSEELSTSRAQ